MRRLTLTALTLLALSGPSFAQGTALPNVSFPEPGTFCAPFQLCTPLVSQDARD